MSTYLALSSANATLSGEIVRRHYEADSERKREHRSVVLLQSWYRGCRIRRALAHLQTAALRVQTAWRAHLARRRYCRRLQWRVQLLQRAHYDTSAVTIQRWWRGYRSRQRLFCFSQWTGYLRHVQRVAEHFRCRVESHTPELGRAGDEGGSVESESDQITSVMVGWSRDEFRHYMKGTELHPDINHSPYRAGNLCQDKA